MIPANLMLLCPCQTHHIHMQVEDTFAKVVTHARVQLVQKIKGGVAKIANKIMDKVHPSSSHVPIFSLHPVA